MKTVSLLVVSLALAASTVSQQVTNYNQGNGSELLKEKCHDEILEQYLVERFPNAFIKVFKRIMTSVGSIPLKLPEVYLKGKGNSGMLHFTNGRANLDFIERDTLELVNKRKFTYTFKVLKIDCIFYYNYVSTLGVEEGKVSLHIFGSTLTFSSSAQMNGDNCTVDTPTLQLNRSKEFKVKHQVEFHEGHNTVVEKAIVSHIGQYLPNILEMVQSRITDVMTDVWVMAQREAEPLVDLLKVRGPQSFCLILTRVVSLFSPKDPVCDKFA